MRAEPGWGRMARMTLDEALARNEELEAEIAELRVAVSVIPQLQAQIAAFQARIEELEARLAADSRSSSKPPSSDAPWDKPRKRDRPKKRKRGGQKGHKGSHRSMLPASEVDQIVDHRPIECEDCGALLLGEDPSPQRWQVTEVPAPRVRVTEHRSHSLRCSHCGRENRAQRPAATSSAFGERAHAFAGWLSGQLRLSKRNVKETLARAFGLELSLGSVCRMERRMSMALEAPHAEAWAAARGAPVINADQTTWYEGHTLAYMWAMATPELQVYQIRDRQDAEAAKAFLGENPGQVVCTDRHGAFVWIERRALCWAHIARNFEAMAKAKGGHWYGRRLRAAAGRVMTTATAYARGEIDEAARDLAFDKAHAQAARTLRLAAEQPHFKAVQRQAATLLKDEEQLWTFREVPGMQADNNLAERALRTAVIWRKLSFGTDSPAGSRFVERILTAVETLRVRDQDVLGFLTEAYAAHLHGRPAPSLLA